MQRLEERGQDVVAEIVSFLTLKENPSVFLQALKEVEKNPKKPSLTQVILQLKFNCQSNVFPTNQVQ